MNKSLLFISFQYPPEQASSGLLRSLSFSRELSNLGWKICVLTASQAEADVLSEENITLVPKGLKIVRKRAYDAAKSFSIKGRYPGVLEWPDRYSSWVIPAMISGFNAIKKDDLSFVFSTYPIASAHLVGYFLAKLLRRPWIADFRDPMVMANHPDTPLRRRAHAWVENKTIHQCSLALFTTESAKQHYINCYPTVAREKFHVIENGFDEEIFALARTKLTAYRQKSGNKLRILHSGTLYPDLRDPEPLLAAIRNLKNEWQQKGVSPEFIFRASGYDNYYAEMLAKYEVEEFVSFLPSISYVESISEVLAADGLLLVQGSSCNNQIPAKLYEYLHAQKPIFAVTDLAGATAATLDGKDRVTITDTNDADNLERNLHDFIEKELCNIEVENSVVERSDSMELSRTKRAKELNEILKAKYNI